MTSTADLRRSVLITADELRDLLADDVPGPVVLDVRWSLAEPDGHRAYVCGHIPGAQFVDLEGDLSASAGPGGRHPLPDIDDLQAAARRWGLRTDDAVVVYDDSGGTSAARAWWLLRWGGVASVRILDGGLRAWQDAGGILEDGAVSRPAGNITLSAGHMPLTDAIGAAGFASDGVLLDARATERYTGETEPVDPRSGHIPGARSAPTTENLHEDQTFLDDSELREHFADVGVDGSERVAVYCGSGVTAAHEVAALRAIGIDATLYAGSWSHWCADSARPVATGLSPSGDPA